MRIYQIPLRFILLLITLSCANTILAQNGDQILDGIGETGLRARYIFNGDLKDWSRNNLHANTDQQGINFIEDSRFGKVLALSGKGNSYISLPAAALTELESLTITGWIYLRSGQVGQSFFDYGADSTRHFFTAPLGLKQTKGYQATLMAGNSQSTAASLQAIEQNKWVHLAVVVDIPSKAVIIYADGKPVAKVVATPALLTALFNNQAGKKSSFYLGRSLLTGAPLLNALVHDFRLYRVPLSAGQVAGIFRNAQKGINAQAVNVGPADEDRVQQFAANTPQLFNKYLTNVSDVKVTTTEGNLPRLPSHITGTYRNNKTGPKVRVLWPSPTNNTAVLKTGSYTVEGRVPGTTFKPKAFITIIAADQTATPKLALEAFDLNKVTLQANANGHQTKFIENRNKFISTLAKTDPNSFLYMFRHAFGQAQPAGAKPLGVWDSEDTKLRGHATGHYLSALAQAYAGTTYDPQLRANFAKKLDYIINTLYELSELSGKPKQLGGAFVADPAAIPYGPGKTTYDSDLSEAGIRRDYWNWGKGFISAYPPDQFIMLEKGAKYGGQSNQIWAPYYTLHKILAGLIDVYEMTGNQKALKIATQMGDWVYARLNKLPEQALITMWNTYIAGEFGGMNESMAHLYRITKNPDYLKTAQLFDNIKVFYGDTNHIHGLAKNVDIFRGLHANQHIPQIVGSIEEYRVTNHPEYYKIADNFWHKIADDYMYSIGGVAGARNPANAECFVAQPSTLYENGFSEGGQNETCATYNMLKLTGDLFLYDQRAEFMDYYERGLYNHILASVAENNPANTYHVSLRPGSVKQFSNADMTGFTCCNGTALESSTKLQNTIYYKSKDNTALYVNLYIPSTLEWTERKIKIAQSTSYPQEDHTQLTIQGSGKFDLHVRVPEWATGGFFVEINGQPQKVRTKPGSYLKISRNWKNGDKVDLKMPFQFHLDPVMDQQNIASLFYGPILLAAQEPEARKDWRKVTFDAENIGRNIKGDPKQLKFTIDGVVFKPFYDTYGRHSVYLNVNLK